MLDHTARRALKAGATAPVTVWELGIVSDGWEKPGSAKPIQVGGGSDGTGGATAYAIGSEAAPLHQEELRPLWRAFLNWLDERSHTHVYLLADEIWSKQGRWVEFGEALAQGAFGAAKLDAINTTTPGVYATTATLHQLSTVTEDWWPSGLGTLAGVSLRIDTDGHGRTRIMRRGQLSATDLPIVRQCFQTAPSFDNLGFVVLSHAESWRSIRDALEVEGWSDGKPLEAVLERL